MSEEGWALLIPDILNVIFKTQSANQLVALGLVCKSWHTFQLRSELWKHVCVRDLSYADDTYDKDSASWRLDILTARKSLKAIKSGKVIPRRIGRKFDYEHAADPRQGTHTVQHSNHFLADLHQNKVSIAWIHSPDPWGSYITSEVIEVEVVDLQTGTRKTISEGSGYVRQVGDHYIGARWVNRYYYSGPVWQSFVHAPIAETPNANYLYRELKNTPERQIRWDPIKEGFEADSYYNKYEFEIVANTDGSPTILHYERPQQDKSFKNCTFKVFDITISNEPVFQYQRKVVENIHVVDLVGKKIVIMDNASLYTVDWTTGEVNTIRTFFKKDSLARYDLDSDVEQPEYNPDADNSDEDQEEEEDDYSELSLVRSKFAKLIGNEIGYVIDSEEAELLCIINIITGNFALRKDFTESRTKGSYSYSNEAIRMFGFNSTRLVVYLGGPLSCFGIFDRMEPDAPLVSCFTIAGKLFTGGIVLLNNGSQILTHTDQLILWDFSETTDTTKPIRVMILPPADETGTSMNVKAVMVAPNELISRAPSLLGFDDSLRLTTIYIENTPTKKISMVYNNNEESEEDTLNRLAKAFTSLAPSSRCRAEPLACFRHTEAVPDPTSLPEPSKGRYDQGRHMWHTKNVYGSVCIFQEELIDGTWRFVDHPDDFEYIYKHAPANVITVTE